MKKAFAKFFLLFTSFNNQSMTLRIFICRIFNILSLPIPIFKFKILLKRNIKYSYLTVNLREISSSNHVKYYDDKYNEYYNWSKLENSILNHGVLTPLLVTMCNKIDPTTSVMCKYCVSNGNHRIAILKKLYPHDYKVKIKLNNNLINSKGHLINKCDK